MLNNVLLQTIPYAAATIISSTEGGGTTLRQVIFGGASASEATSDLSFRHITMLTFEAVLEVIIICFFGFIAAKTGLLNTKNQKVISQLNVDLFTPCLVFTKLASSLSLKKLVDIIIIPIFYALSTGISYICALVVSKFFGLNEPETDFVTAMGVFGNSNSLPVSLTLALSYTLPDLLWDDIDDDNQDKVASRGILYLLIFQQLGQILRWSWGFNKLLRKRSYEELHYYEGVSVSEFQGELCIESENVSDILRHSGMQPDGEDDDNTNKSPVVVVNEEELISLTVSQAHFDVASSSSSTTSIEGATNQSEDEIENSKVSHKNHNLSMKCIRCLWFSIKNSKPVQGFLAFMNPPLYAMLVSIVVASISPLRLALFPPNPQEPTFVSNTFTRAIGQLGSVSIPLILIVLGSNLYPSSDLPPESKHYNRIVFGSLLSRMILPSLILLPIIALLVKYVNISILDDPIFLIVAFVLTISPPAIQLSQITQLNNIYQKEMAGVLFWGYVILTLPTTIFIVVTSLEVLKWAN
ncbi:uncharacterized protein KQ657_004624 [Scheffersomyces spartinae]|uniref:Transporter n=1 Tax=Scheffersomyces spartinae TaxID=45513 RepID=A0A9P7VAG2_9ASCO|nr:uncharacterized protein KQ657_004624 [Scheffersomyces spartinae]KAG7194411.1 hypothetical protein KQ657_004624 [Scheffersomyces spartinae]